MFILYNERKRRNNNDTFIQILIRVLDYTHIYKHKIESLCLYYTGQYRIIVVSSHRRNVICCCPRICYCCYSS
jgi:hypothetical protein